MINGEGRTGETSVAIRGSGISMDRADHHLSSSDDLQYNRILVRLMKGFSRGSGKRESE